MKISPAETLRRWFVQNVYLSVLVYIIGFKKAAKKLAFKYRRAAWIVTVEINWLNA